MTRLTRLSVAIIASLLPAGPALSQVSVKLLYEVPDLPQTSPNLIDQNIELPHEIDAQPNMSYYYEINKGGRILKALYGTITTQTAAQGKFREVGGTYGVEEVVYNGYLYLSGFWPYGTTNTGSSSSPGSTILVQTKLKRDGVAVDRFFFLSGPEMIAKTKPAAQEETLDVPCYFVDIAIDKQIIYGPFPVGSAQEQAISIIQGRAARVGMPTPSCSARTGSPKGAFIEVDEAIQETLQSLQRLRDTIRGLRDSLGF